MTCNDLLENIGAAKFKNDVVLNSDYLIYTIIASFVAVLGFLNNNVIPIIASMIISPLLGPFYVAISESIIQTGSIFSANGKIWKKAFSHHLFLMSICFAIAFTCGIANYYSGVFEKESYEMSKRSKYDTLIADITIALVCGVGIAIATVRNDTLVQVGFVISVTVLPPLVNCGLYTALCATELFKNVDDREEKKLKEYTKRIKNTIIITIINMLIICIGSYITYYFIC